MRKCETSVLNCSICFKLCSSFLSSSSMRSVGDFCAHASDGIVNAAPMSASDTARAMSGRLHREAGIARFECEAFKVKSPSAIPD